MMCCCCWKFNSFKWVKNCMKLYISQQIWMMSFLLTFRRWDAVKHNKQTHYALIIEEKNTNFISDCLHHYFVRRNGIDMARCCIVCRLQTAISPIPDWVIETIYIQYWIWFLFFFSHCCKYKHKKNAFFI